MDNWKAALTIRISLCKNVSLGRQIVKRHFIYLHVNTHHVVALPMALSDRPRPARLQLVSIQRWRVSFWLKQL